MLALTSADWYRLSGTVFPSLLDAGPPRLKQRPQFLQLCIYPFGIGGPFFSNHFQPCLYKAHQPLAEASQYSVMDDPNLRSVERRRSTRTMISRAHYHEQGLG